MDTPRSKSKKSKKKASRQSSPRPLRLNSRPDSPVQPEAGPSRLPQQPDPVAISETFSSNADFIAFEVEEDERPKHSTRVWDRGKSDRDWDKERDRDRQWAGRKRRWEESERDGAYDLRSADIKKSSLNSKKAPWTADVDWDSCRNVAELLHKEVKAYLHYISPTVVEHEVRWMIVQLISTSIKRAYPDSEVLPFGSFGTKLYLPQGDIDLVIQSQQLAYNEKLSALRSLANIVRRTGVTDKVTIISKARVPIIKFVTLYGRFAVDISMNQSNGVQTGAMINRFLDEFPALRTLVLVVKAFLKHRNLNEVYSGGLGSYAIVCLAVSFLQATVAHISFKMHPKVRRAEIDSAKNLGVLVLEFFELYGKYFNYSNTGISLRHGGSYFSKRKRGWLDFSKPHLLCIEDPGDISNDISRGSYGIKKVKQTFAGAYDIMLSALYVSAEILSARQGGRVVDLRHGSSIEHSSDEMSVLSSILRVDQETINHRRLVQEVHEKGTLARLLGVDPRAGQVYPAQTGEEKQSREKEAESVAAAWGEADMVFDSEEEAKRAAPTGAMANGKSRQNGRKRDAPGDDDDESRYDIVARRNGRDSHNEKQGDSARKRRRDDRSDIKPTVSTFVSDESEDEGENDIFAKQLKGYADSDGLDEIERAYAAAADELADSHSDEEEDSAYLKGSKGKGKDRLSNKLRQAYWASKSVRGVDSDSS